MSLIPICHLLIRYDPNCIDLYLLISCYSLCFKKYTQPILSPFLILKHSTLLSPTIDCPIQLGGGTVHAHGAPDRHGTNQYINCLSRQIVSLIADRFSRLPMPAIPPSLCKRPDQHFSLFPTLTPDFPQAPQG